MRVDPTILYQLKKQISAIRREEHENVLNSYLMASQKDKAGLFLNEVVNKTPQAIIFSKPVSSAVKQQDDKTNEINQTHKPRKPS